MRHHARTCARRTSSEALTEVLGEEHAIAQAGSAGSIALLDSTKYTQIFRINADSSGIGVRNTVVGIPGRFLRPLVNGYHSLWIIRSRCWPT